MPGQGREGDVIYHNIVPITEIIYGGKDLVEGGYLLISIMQFPMSDSSDLTEKDLSISQKLLLFDLNLWREFIG